MGETSNAIEIWQIPLGVSADRLDRYFACLSKDEQAKATRFRFADDRRRFIVARATLRHLLGLRLKRSPETISFCYSEYGKPRIDPSTAASTMPNASCEFHFNLSHSGELALCALGGEHTVGVDIEAVKPMQRLDSLIDRCLSANERSQVQAAADQPRAFLQRWTCKEAYLKAIGLGLSQSMQMVEVQLAPPLLAQVPHDCDEGWNLYLLALPADYVGALVVRGSAAIQLRQWQHVTLDARQ
jgi:4'-phosphopantetheinyl transferase